MATVNKSSLRAEFDALKARFESLCVAGTMSADSVVNAVFTAICDGLVQDEAVAIAGFGTFSIKQRPARSGRNPRTGEPITIAASAVPAFKASKALRDAVS